MNARLVAGLLLVLLSAATAAPPLAFTLAWSNDAEAATALFVADVHVATNCVAWAADDRLDVTSSRAVYDGCLHGVDVRFLGNANTVERTVRFVDGLRGDVTNTLLRGSVQVAREPYPFPFALADYAPGGRAAEAALAEGAYHVHPAGARLSAPLLVPGLHYVDGDADVDAAGFEGALTVVAAGRLRLALDDARVVAYVDGLLAHAEGAGLQALDADADRAVLEGVLHAPNGRASLDGDALDLRGQVAAARVDLGGKDARFLARAPHAVEAASTAPTSTALAPTPAAFPGLPFPLEVVLA